MREIKFRLRIGNKIVGYEEWDIGTGDNAGWFYCKNPTGKYPENVWRPDYIYHTEKDQYTSLPDKNGKEIWEGDIILNHNYDTKGEVRWVDENAEYICYHASGWFKFTDEYEVEIIGNIYENPELLEEQK